MIYCGLATSPQQCTVGGNKEEDKIGDNIEEAWRFIAFAFFASLIPTSAVVVQVKVAAASFFVVDDGIAYVVVCAKVPRRGVCHRTLERLPTLRSWHGAVCRRYIAKGCIKACTDRMLATC